MQGLVNGVKQREQVVEPSQLDGTDHWTSVIDHDVQWFAQSPGSAGGVDQGLQTRRAQECHAGQIDHESRPVGKLVEPGGNRRPEPVDGEHIDLPGHRHHQRLAPGMHHPAGSDPHHLLGSRTQAGAEISIAIANTRLVHPRTISSESTG